MDRRLTILDTGAGPNFVRLSKSSLGARRFIREGPLPNINDANSNPLKTLGSITLIVRLGHRLVALDFVVCLELAAEVILGCDFCDRFVESIHPRRREIELDDGSTVPIVRRPLKRPPKCAPLTTEQEYAQASGRDLTKIRVCEAITLPPESQRWIRVMTKRHGSVLVEPSPSLYEKQQCSVSNGIAQAEPLRPFRILCANFSKLHQRLVKNQVVAQALSHPTEVRESNVSFADALGLIDANESLSKHRTTATDKASLLSKTIDTITTKLLADERVSSAKNDEGKLSVEDIDLSTVPREFHEEIREMLRKHEDMWSGHLGEIGAVRHRIEVQVGAKPIAVPPFRAGPKQRELEIAEVERQLKAGVIEPAHSEWASPIVFATKADGTQRFCVDYRRLNSITVTDTYPLPRTDECIDSLGDATIFSTLDTNAGYWQIPVHEDDRDKTAFVCHRLYRYRRMPFELTNAPATFQRALDLLLAGYRWKTCLIF